MERGYVPLVRIAGKWKQVGGVTTKGGAARRGAGVALRTPARSFKVQPTNIRIFGSEEPAINLREFRQPKFGSKLGRNVFVEKSKYAINLPEEFMGITLKGARSPKRKRKGARR